MGVICVLPARLHSRRIPRKPLQQIAGRSLVDWCWRAAGQVRSFDRVVVATDAAEIEACARAFGAEVVRTRPDHRSGTDRVEEAAGLLGAAEDDVVVNFQADEPFVAPAAVEGAVRRVQRGAPVATIAVPIRSETEWQSSAVVKAVRAADGRALYFSRAPIPFLREDLPRCDAPGRLRGLDAPGVQPVSEPLGVQPASEPPGGAGPAHETPAGCQPESGTPVRLRHVGIYAYRRSTLRHWSAAPESVLERTERLEQLRALEAGIRIDVELAPWSEPGIDVPADLERAERILSGGPGAAFVVGGAHGLAPATRAGGGARRTGEAHRPPNARAVAGAGYPDDLSARHGALERAASPSAGRATTGTSAHRTGGGEAIIHATAATAPWQPRGPQQTSRPRRGPQA